MEENPVIYLRENGRYLYWKKSDGIKVMILSLVSHIFFDGVKQYRIA